jgi:hypothetical protein
MFGALQMKLKKTEHGTSLTQQQSNFLVSALAGPKKLLPNTAVHAAADRVQHQLPLSQPPIHQWRVALFAHGFLPVPLGT